MRGGTLRRAALRMRIDHQPTPGETVEDAAWLRVADWLDHCAAIEAAHGLGGTGTDFALAVAITYLGEA